MVVVLVGNKTDLVEKRAVSTEEGDARAREAGVLFIETSAKAGFNIKARFEFVKFSLVLTLLSSSGAVSEDCDGAAGDGGARGRQGGAGGFD